jgi:DNA-binding MarR family transcriptional regulator
MLMEGNHGMDTDISEEVIVNLRKISRAVELHSKGLFKEYGLTSPQLTILMTIVRQGSLTVSDLARRISMSQATATSILSRLEQQGFVTRARSTGDKRMVYIEVTEKTRLVLENKPSPLHNDFLRRFKGLQSWEQTMLLSSLQRIAKLMDVHSLDEV